MPLVKQTGIVLGARRNLNILCDVFLLGLMLIGILLAAAPGCCAKVETQIKLLDDDYTLPTWTGNDEAAAASSASSSLEPTVPHYNLYKNDLDRISYETIHRILRDENEPMIYRTNDLRFFQKRSSVGGVAAVFRPPAHGISKRSAPVPTTGIRLNLAGRNLETFSREEVLSAAHSLEDVTAINLHNNSLREFPLAAVPNLTEVDLSANNFTHFELPPGSTQLRAVNLNQNRIVNFTTTTTLSSRNSSTTTTRNNLRELQLKDNEIRSLGQLNLSLLNELEILDLSCNQLENLETAFFPTRMKNLKYLNLARNRLQCIYRETFYNLLSVNTLTLSYNEITEIDYETFLALPNLQFLDLSHNRLRGDSIRALQGIPDLVGLSIAYNWELGDSMQEFVASWSLKELDASGTGLCKIPAALAQSVRTLKLADNWLTIINCGDLDSYPLLQYLDLSHSHIDEIEEDALGRLEILETLFLDHNNLKRIPISLPTSLETLFLHDNQILDIQPQAFQGLNNLKTLDLSGNKLLYLPEMPLPKLLTLNLQSSGINGLHQAIVKTSPHLRDLYLEDNPIKCADLLGIAEWASPCRNDRRITERINIKSHYVRMHNYFERFQCGGDAAACATCMGDASTPPTLTSATKPNCVDVNGPGRVTKLTTELLLLTQDRKNNEEPTRAAPTAALPNTKFPLTRKTYAESTSTTTDANQVEPQATTNAPATAAARPEVSTPTTTTAAAAGGATTASRIQTNSTDKISLLPPQKQLADGSPSPAPAQIKSDNNYVETSASSSSRPPPRPGSLLSQENTGKSQKGLKAQSDNATKIGRSLNGGTSVAPAAAVAVAAKSNLPTTKAPTQQQQHQQQHTVPHSGEAMTKTTTTTRTAMPMPTTTTTTTTTMAMAMTIGQIAGERGSGQQQEQLQQQQQQQQHNRIQEILHTKDRHLIGTPLLMHKGHVVLVPPAADPVRTTTTMPTTTAMTSKENLLLLAQRQDGGKGSHGSSSTTITTSKGHKLEMAADHHHPQPNHHYQQQQQQQQHQQQQQGSNENAVIKGATRKKMTNGPLGQENHYQDIQHTQQQHKVVAQHRQPPKKMPSPLLLQQQQPNIAVADKDTTSATQQKSKETTPTSPSQRKDKDRRHNINDDDDDNGGPSDKQFQIGPAKTQQHRSLNTPLDGEISRRGRDNIFREIDGAEAATTPPPPPTHHSRVNTPLLRNDDDLQNLNAPDSQKSTIQSATEGQTMNHSTSSASTSAALIKLETGPRTAVAGQHTAAAAAQQPERWLDIRKATRHPGLVVVIGVTFAMVFVLGLVQVYRYRQKPLNYISHRHYGYPNEHHQHQQQYQHHLHQQGSNHNQCSSYGCNDDRLAAAVVQPTTATSASSASSYGSSSPHHLLRIHEKPPTPTGPPPLASPPSMNCEFQREKCSSVYATNRSSSSSTTTTTTTTSNYRLFQLNGRRIKHNHHHPPRADDETDFYTEMNHGPQSVLASDFFPMELLRLHQSSPSPSPSPSSIVVPSSSSKSSSSKSASPPQPPPPPPPPATAAAAAVSLVGHQQQLLSRSAHYEFQDIAAGGRERSKFEIW